MKFISRAEIYFTLISSTIDSLEANIWPEMIVWQSSLPWNHLRALERLRDLYVLSYPFLVIYFMRGSKTRLVRDENRRIPKIVTAKSIVLDTYFVRYSALLPNSSWARRTSSRKIFFLLQKKISEKNPTSPFKWVKAISRNRPSGPLNRFEANSVVRFSLYPHREPTLIERWPGSNPGAKGCRLHADSTQTRSQWVHIKNDLCPVKKWLWGTGNGIHYATGSKSFE